MATTRFHDDTPDVDGLYADVAAADLQPLWTQPGLLTRTPNLLTSHLWRWKTLRDLAERAGDLVGIDRGGDRRVLSLSHPDLGGLPFATHTLWGAVQFLRGGELAPAHRHSPAALRFVLEGNGVWTLVNGDPLHMAPGDLILTPSWTWHEHHNPGTQPMIWFDGLDLPLVRSLDAMFFEPGGEELTPYKPTQASRSEHLYSGVGLLPVSEQATVEDPASSRSSRLLAYRWPTVDAALARLIETTGRRSARIRYTDPVTGRDIMPTVRAEMHRVLAGHRTPTVRTAGSGIWVAFRGSGATVINGRRFRWTAGDIFVTPSWAAVDHEADGDADLFLFSDTPTLEALGLNRTQAESQQDVLAGKLNAAGELRRRPGGVPCRRPGDPAARPDHAGCDRVLEGRGAGGPRTRAGNPGARCPAARAGRRPVQDHRGPGELPRSPGGDERRRIDRGARVLPQGPVVPARPGRDHPAALPRPAL